MTQQLLPNTGMDPVKPPMTPKRPDQGVRWGWTSRTFPVGAPWIELINKPCAWNPIGWSIYKNFTADEPISPELPRHHDHRIHFLLSLQHSTGSTDPWPRTPNLDIIHLEIWHKRKHRLLLDFPYPHIPRTRSLFLYRLGAIMLDTKKARRGSWTAWFRVTPGSSYTSA